MSKIASNIDKIDEIIMKLQDIVQHWNNITEEIGVDKIKQAIHGLCGQLDFEILACYQGLDIPKTEYNKRRTNRNMDSDSK